MSAAGRRARPIGAFIVILMSTLVLAPSATAQSTDGIDDDDQIVLSGQLLVPDDVTVADAVLFSGSARIDGTVERSLVVFSGDVVVTGTVGEDVVVFDGDVRVASGAEIRGDLLTRSSPTVEPGANVRGTQGQISGEVDLDQVVGASRIAWWVGYSASTLALGLLLLLLAPALDAAIARVARERLGASFGFGTLTFVVVPIVTGVLFVTIVGIPLALFLLLAFGLVYSIAYVAGAHAVGRFVVRNPTTSRFVAFLAGWAILRVIALVPVLGGLTWVVATILGFGVIVLAARTRAPAAQPLPPIPPAPAVPQAP